MFPLQDASLEICQIAQLWASDLPGLSEAEILEKLLAAFWTGDLAASRTGEPEASDAERARLLREVSRHDDHPGIRFTTEHVDREYGLPDGSVEVDLRTFVRWPVGAESIQPDPRFSTACAELAKARLLDYSELVRPVLIGLWVSKDAFQAFCKASHYKLPRFWFRDERSLKAPAEASVKRWLADRLARHPSATKTDIWEMARRENPAPSKAVFDRIWKAVAPPNRKKPGRRR